MNNHDLTITAVLIASALLGAVYSWFLEQIHDVYSPRQTWLAVVIGNGAVVDTILILDRQLGIEIDGVLVLYVMVAWGAPVVLWQLWQNRQREKQVNGKDH